MSMFGPTQRLNENSMLIPIHRLCCLKKWKEMQSFNQNNHISNMNRDYINDSNSSDSENTLMVLKILKMSKNHRNYYSHLIILEDLSMRSAMTTLIATQIPMTRPVLQHHKKKTKFVHRKVTDTNGNLPPAVPQSTAEAEADLIPNKSIDKYEAVYTKYVNWATANNVDDTELFSETALMAYFRELSMSTAPNSMFFYYSMIKSLASVRDHIDLFQHRRLLAYLRKKEESHIGKICSFLGTRNYQVHSRSSRYSIFDGHGNKHQFN